MVCVVFILVLYVGFVFFLKGLYVRCECERKSKSVRGSRRRVPFSVDLVILITIIIITIIIIIIITIIMITILMVIMIMIEEKGC